MHTTVRILLHSLALGVLVCSCATLNSQPPKHERGEQEVPRNQEKAAEQKAQLIRYKYTPREITQLCDEAIQSAESVFNEIATLAADQRTPANTLLRFEKASADFGNHVTPLTFMGYVSTDSAISKEGSDCEQKINQFAVGIYTRKDLYLALRDQKPKNPQEKRLLAETLKAFEDNGLKLPDSKLNEVRELKKRLAKLETDFSTNLNQDNTTVEYALEELAGVNPDFIKSLKTTSVGKVIVTTKGPHYERIMDYAENGETRRKMLFAYENRAAEKNIPLLEEAVRLRKQIAEIMGYKTWADYRVHTRMAKNSKTILSFLNGLKSKLTARNQKDLEKLLTLKKKLDPSARQLEAWDIRYLSNQLKKRNLNLDDEKLREYFPADRVVSGMFQVYSQLLGVNYVEKKDADTWAEGVKLYEIRNKEDDQLISYFYADFIPRPGKYGHAAAFTLISGRTLSDGTYSLPVSSIVANFSPPEGDKPALMNHQEVRTIFHEFGHIMHQTLTRAPYASLSGSSVDQDFVEAPSQMLENWVFEKEILSMISGHYKDPSLKLPDDLLQKLIEVRDFNQGYVYTRQLLFGLLDMGYHTSESPVDSTKLFQTLHKELFGISSIPGGHFPASFGHLMGGYDAGYYGYLWSEVYAADMYTQFKKKGLLSSEVGGLYRKWVLEPGKMIDANKILLKFLERKPSPNAFYQRLGIKP